MIPQPDADHFKVTSLRRAYLHGRLLASDSDLTLPSAPAKPHSITLPSSARLHLAPHLPVQVMAGEHVRTVLASDGVWDLLSLEDGARIARKAQSAQAAAKAIVDLTNKRSMTRFGRLKDDTTCVVVDLNPTQSPFVAPVSEGSNCCSVS